ncbi:hypothetical protein L596_022558 [Steinernema carpocapsae]|uniref:Uncharacterized protein n=1 Tax=Steinernema carpocapsae TaxID=34508 RepID=A0A4V6A091_STECR|nr:hypothetical protein L596_022558 [Steinernema carpocapsae]
MGFSHDNQVVNSVTTAMSKVQISEPQTKTDCVYSRMEVAKMGRRLGKTQEMPQILKCAIRLNEVGFIPSDTYDAWGRWVERQALCKPGYPVPGTPWGPPLPQAKPQNGFGSSSRSSSYASSSSRPKINGSGHFGQGDVLEVPVVQDPVAHQASVIAMDPAPIVHVAPPHVVHQAPVVHEAPAPPPVAQGPVIHLVPTPNVARNLSSKLPSPSSTTCLVTSCLNATRRDSTMWSSRKPILKPWPGPTTSTTGGRSKKRARKCCKTRKRSSVSPAAFTIWKRWRSSTRCP